MHTILVPTDFTTDCELAFQIACSIARDQACEVIVLHVIRPEDCSKQDLDDGEIDRDSTIYQSCRDRFSRLQAMAYDVPMSFQIKAGQLVETIIAVAEAECCDAIVLAAHPHSYFHRQMYGSISESLSTRSRCPVICLHPPGFRQEKAPILTGLRAEMLADTGVTH